MWRAMNWIRAYFEVGPDSVSTVSAKSSSVNRFIVSMISWQEFLKFKVTVSLDV